MSLHTEIVNLESILTNCENDYTCEELANMEEDLFKLKHIADLWAEFSAVPMDPRLEIIETEWHKFPAGTHREAIWHWFEKHFHISVTQDLMYDCDETNNNNNKCKTHSFCTEHCENTCLNWPACYGCNAFRIIAK